MIYTVFELATGKIERVVRAPVDAPPQFSLDTHGAIEGVVDDSAYYIDTATLALVPIPVQPGPYHVFDWPTKTWADPRTLTHHQDAAWARIKLDRAAAAVAPLTVGAHTFDADPTSQQLITGAAQMALLAQSSGQPWQIEWTLADNSSATLTAPDMLAVALALAQQVDAAHQRGRLLRAQIYATTDPHQLTNITWHAP